MLTDLELLIDLEKTFTTSNEFSTKGLCFAVWQKYKPADAQNKRIIELLAAHSQLDERLSSVYYSYWWPKGERKPRLETIKRAINSLTAQ